MSEEKVICEQLRGSAARLPVESRSAALNSAIPSCRGDQKTTSEDKHWAVLSEGFPPGVTVDELKKYRRRRQVTELKDNLPTEEGTLQTYKSEYKRRYGVLDHIPNLDLDFPRNRSILKRPPSNLRMLKDSSMDYCTEKNSQYVRYVNPERAKLLRRSTALKPEGDFLSETEVRSQFRCYDHPEKVYPIRRSPSLKLEGDFETLTTEQKEKFVSHLLVERPMLRKKSTLLKMEGDFDFLTEKQVNYVEHGANERLGPRKRSTSLRLDGEVEFFPEYRSSYVDFPRSRPITYKPMENLRNEGDLESLSETKTKFVDFREFPASLPARPANNLQMEGGLEIRPEYKENFIDFPRTRPLTMRPEDQLQQEGDLDFKPENEELSKILADIKRPLTLRRPSNLRLEGDLEFSTEKRDQFKRHEITAAPSPACREGSLHLEGDFNFKTESEDKYVANPLPVRIDFRKRSSFLHSDGEFRSVFDWGRLSPREIVPNRPKAKVAPPKTPYFGVNEELLEGCNRRTSRRNSKRLKDTVTLAESIPVGRGENDRKSPPSDNLRLDTYDYSCQEKKTYDPAFAIVDNPRINVDEEVSDDSVLNHPPSFRLEVYNVDANPQGFHKGNRRIFPPEGIPSDTLSIQPGSFLEKKRNEYYDTAVNCPDVPNYILDRNNNLGTRVWDGKQEGSTLKAPKIDDKPNATLETRSWTPPNWLTT